MGILKLEMKQQAGDKKTLPNKPKQAEHVNDISKEENLWVGEDEKQVTLGTPEPLTEEEDCFKSIWDINVTVSEGCVPPYEAHVLAENNDSLQTCAAPSGDLEDSWGHGSYHPPAAVVEGREELSDINTIINSDLSNYALNECDIHGFQQDKNDLNMIRVEVINNAAAMHGPLLQASTNSFIHQLPAIDNSPLTFSNQITKQSKTSVGKKVGRPARQTPLEITEVPRAGLVSVTPEEIRKLKYRRMRDQNNEASKKCRMKRKQKLNAQEQECREEEEKQEMLKEKLQQMEQEAASWRVKYADIVGVNL